MHTQPRNVLVRESLIRSISAGESVAAWCRRMRTARSTASKWQADSSFAADLEEYRRLLSKDGLSDVLRRVSILEKRLLRQKACQR